MAVIVRGNLAKRIEKAVNKSERAPNYARTQRRRNVTPPSHNGIFIGKANAAINKNSAGVVRIYGGSPPGETDTGITITAYNRTANITAERWVTVTLIGGYPYVAALECDS